MELSILIPSRNEMFLRNTIEDILANSTAEIEIIAVCDGALPTEPVPQYPNVTILLLNESVGQRAGLNMACNLARGKYIMKLDAHCSTDKGFDTKMLDAFKETGDNVVMVPIMRNLHAFDWKCTKCGVTRYQGPSGPCVECKAPTEMDLKWIGKDNPQSTSFCFDPTPHFQYFGSYKEKQKGDIVETMSLQGSCFMMTKERYQGLNICDEKFGSWGSQGIEVALKMWLSGGRVLVNKRTWYAHMFRTQGGDFSFPYKLHNSDVNKAKAVAKKMFTQRFEGQIHPVSWLIERFAPVEHWSEEDIAELKAQESSERGIIYYTDNQLNVKIAQKVQKNIKSIGLPIVSSSLKPMDFGNNAVIDHKRGRMAYFMQIVDALQRSSAKIVYFCEHDVLYNPTHFDFVPPEKDKFYFNVNVWKVEWGTGRALKVDDCKQISGLVCYRELALAFYERKLKEHKAGNFDFHYEPQEGRESFSSEKPLYDIRHDNNLTKTRWNKSGFRDKKYTVGWKTDNIKL